ncbi:nucleotidyltransferase family protein [Marinobacter sp. R17]|uniref:nucleotidyltransferase family protein n=1 Tax=Marinobacter sp. R17 TaxID=2484250 RepID=UPI000F4C2C09|nr:nucleotidyltransferase family protein [Marinobacter sp. R17]ROU01836.1 nucleotidyltransferase family protein [Marinobacter sp. R17]
MTSDSGYGAIVLAAGASRRMGRPKAALSYCGKSLLSHAIDHARSLSGGPVYAVVGGDYPLVRFRCASQPDRWLFNHDWPTGMASSLRAGLDAMPVMTRGVYVLLVDQPEITPGFWEAFRETVVRSAGRRPVAADLGGFSGAPAFLPRALWPELMQLSGDAGAGAVLRRRETLRVPAPGADRDVDTPADMQRLRGVQTSERSKQP